MKYFLYVLSFSLFTFSNLAVAQDKKIEIEIKLNEFNIDGDIGMSSSNNDIQPFNSYNCTLTATISSENKILETQFEGKGINRNRYYYKFDVKETVKFELSCPKNTSFSLFSLLPGGFSKGTLTSKVYSPELNKTFTSSKFGCARYNSDWKFVVPCEDAPYVLPTRLSFTGVKMNEGSIALILQNGKASVVGTPYLITGSYTIL